MAFDIWTMLYSALVFLVFSIRNITTQSCGGNFHTNNGVFASPNYPNAYNTSVHCTYIISLSTISSITLSFETFELDRSSADYISITCASNISYAQKTYYWNSNIPPISIPWCSSGRVDFYSDSRRSYTARGFKVQYQVNTKDCGNTVFNSSSGNISSPNYPQNYKSDQNCTYSIWAPESSSFTLTFKTFSLQSDCQRDWVQIRCDNSGQILPKYCGSTLPRPAYISNCSKVLIWFHSGNYDPIYFSGFSLQYSATPDGCGQSHYAGLSGVITSPNYPKGYNQISCRYDLYLVSSVTLRFQSFDLEPFTDSSKGDYVQIECISNYSYDSYIYRGNILPPLISYKLCGFARITFSANAALSGTGFNVKYQINPLVAHSAITKSPKDFTVNYGSKVQLDCESDAQGYYPSWTLSKDGTNEDTIVIAYFCEVNSYYYNDYYVVSNGPGVCNLVIESATPAETGVYTCIDASLASASSVVIVGEHTVVAISVFSVILTICILGYIGITSLFIVRRRREISREEEGQRNSAQERQSPNDSAMIQAMGSVYEDINDRALSPGSSTMTAKDDEDHYEHLNHVFSNPVAIDTPNV